VLGDRRDRPEFIRTFPKRGYQFVAAVVDEKPAIAVKRVQTLFAVPEVGRTADRE
jgi:DNA-binding winged helix-turn-helix (wHTH) protein